MKLIVESNYEDTFNDKYSQLDLDIFNFIENDLNDQVGVGKWADKIAKKFNLSDDEAESYIDRYKEYSNEWVEDKNKSAREFQSALDKLDAYIDQDLDGEFPAPGLWYYVFNWFSDHEQATKDLVRYLESY